MKRLAWFCAAAFPFARSSRGSGGGQCISEPPRYDRGVIVTGTYTNACLGFSLTLPEGWEANNPGAKAPGVAIHVGGGLLLLTLNRQTIGVGRKHLASRSGHESVTTRHR